MVVGVRSKRGYLKRLFSVEGSETVTLVQVREDDNEKPTETPSPTIVRVSVYPFDSTTP